MKTLLVLIVGISFLSVSNSGSVHLKAFVDCPKCDEEYKACTGSAEKAYTTAVQKAADSSSSKSSKVNYSVACEEARRIKNKAISECTETYNKCCLVAAKENKKTKKE